MSVRRIKLAFQADPQGHQVLRPVRGERRRTWPRRRASSTSWSTATTGSTSASREIQALEKEGDRIDHEIGQRLEDAFVAPFDREDIHELTVRLDDVVDFIQAVAESLVIYDVRSRPRTAASSPRILAAAGNRAGRSAHQA